jgi:hypothetical protein
VFLKYYQLLATSTDVQLRNNPFRTLFGNQLRLGSVVMIGHSHRAGSIVYAGRALPLFSGPKPLAYGLIAPEAGNYSGDDLANLLVLGGTLDANQGADPAGAYNRAGTPKTWVEIPGANHYGYTDLVTPDNVAEGTINGENFNLNDSNGAISRTAQQQTAAAFLAAMSRYYALGDVSVRGYLNGQRQVEGLPILDISMMSQGI